MTAPALAELLRAQEATWPPAATLRAGRFVIRDGRGGGKRVSAASLATPLPDTPAPDAPAPDASAPDACATGARPADAPARWAKAPEPPPADEIAAAEAAMTALGQPPLFMLRPGEAALAAALAARGYHEAERVRVIAGPPGPLATPAPPPLAVFDIWEPLEIMRLLWAEGGIGPARLAVMNRVAGPRTALLGRLGDRPAGVAFLALAGPIAFCHALHVTPSLRRQGLARNMLSKAAGWAQDQGATTLAVLVTEANDPARALYASLGMADMGYYAYMAHGAASGKGR